METREIFVGMDFPMDAGVPLYNGIRDDNGTYTYANIHKLGWYESRYDTANNHLGYWHVIPMPETPRVSACMAYAITRTDTNETLAYVSRKDLAEAIASQVSALLGASLVTVMEVPQ